MFHHTADSFGAHNGWASLHAALESGKWSASPSHCTPGMLGADPVTLAKSILCPGEVSGFVCVDGSGVSGCFLRSLLWPANLVANPQAAHSALPAVPQRVEAQSKLRALLRREALAAPLLAAFSTLGGARCLPLGWCCALLHQNPCLSWYSKVARYKHWR